MDLSGCCEFAWLLVLIAEVTGFWSAVAFVAG
jgi:hypothetical protein